MLPENFLQTKLHHLLLFLGEKKKRGSLSSISPRRIFFAVRVLDGSVHRVLARAQIGGWVLHAGVSETRVLLGFQSQAGQAGVASVSVHVGRGGGRVGARRRGHARVERRVAEVVQVVEAVEAGARHAGHRRRHHAGGHGGDGVGRREHGLRGQRVDVHGVEEREALGGQGGGREALGGPVVVRVARVHVVVGLHESVELRAEAVFAELGLLVPLPLPPLGSPVLEPNLEQSKRRDLDIIFFPFFSLFLFFSFFFLANVLSFKSKSNRKIRVIEPSIFLSFFSPPEQTIPVLIPSLSEQNTHRSLRGAS